jgi:NodT family efflux transporter outer membrane factor (OMF) lipoprotein
MNNHTMCLRSPLKREQHTPVRQAESPKRKLGGQSALTHERKASIFTAATMLGAVLATALLVTGCASPNGATPHSQQLMTAEQLGVKGGEAPWPKTDWWTGWGDAQLNAIVEKALATQPSLQTVQARLVQAQAAVDASNAARLPQVNGSLDLTDQRFTKNGMVPPPLGGSIKWNNSAQVSASWELDLFGRQKASVASAIGTLRATQAEAQAARVLLAGNVANTYVNLARLIDARKVAQQALSERDQTFKLVRQRVGAGLDTNVELRQAEGFIAQTKVELETLDEQIARTRHALAELSGQAPTAYDTLSPQLAEVKAAPLPQGLPADLIGRRADLVAQRWRVEAALKDVDVAKAQFYPNINLVAFAGLSSIGLDKFVKSGSETYGIGPAVRLPIFEGGRLRANLSAKNAEVDAAIDGYNASLLRALREVADEVSTLQSLERQQAAQDEALKSAESAFDLATQRYQNGLGNFLVVLTAETNVLAQRRAASDLKARHLSAEASLARALGGGYQSDAPATLTAINSQR